MFCYLKKILQKYMLDKINTTKTKILLFILLNSRLSVYN